MAILIAHWRTKGAALHGPCSVELACAGDWIEHGAGFVVCEVFEGVFVLRFGKEDARFRITGEAFRYEAFARCQRSGADTIGDLDGCGCQGLTKSGSIERCDREDADAALMTAGAAGEVRA